MNDKKEWMKEKMGMGIGGNRNGETGLDEKDSRVVEGRNDGAEK